MFLFERVLCVVVHEEEEHTEDAEEDKDNESINPADTSARTLLMALHRLPPRLVRCKIIVCQTRVVSLLSFCLSEEEEEEEEEEEL